MSDTQKHTKPNVPNLRFPGFEGEWEECTFGECCSGFDYGMNAASKPFDGEHKYIRITDIDENTSEYKEDSVVSPDADIDEHYRVNENDILFARTGASTGKTYLYNPKDGRLYFAGFLIRMKVSLQNDSSFVFYQTQTPRYKKWVQIMSMRSGQPGINSQEYSSYPIFLPKREEQERIARLLSLIDQRIAIQNKVIEKYESLIKALAYDTIGKYTPNTLLSECVRCSSSTLKESDLTVEGAVPAYGAAGITGFTDSALSDEDSILITKDGSGVGSLRYVNGPHSFVGTLNSMTSKEEVYLPYIYYALQNVCFDSYRTGQAIPHIYFKDYGKEAIYCPSYEEQVRMAIGLEKIDAKIGLEKAALQSYKSAKVYLLSAMLI